MSTQSQKVLRPGPPFKRLLAFTALFLLLSGAGIGVIYTQFADRSISFDWRLLSWQLLVPALALLAVYYASDGLRLYFTLKALGHRLGLRQVFSLVFINIFFSNITPMATGGGFAQIWYLQRHGIPLGTATAATTIRTMLAVVFIFCASPVFLLMLDALEGKAISGQIGVYLAIFALIYVGFFILLVFHTRRLLPPISGAIGLLKRLHLISRRRQSRWEFKSKREMLRFARSFAVYCRGPKRYLLFSVLFTCIFLLSLLSFPALLMQALGYDVHYLTSLGLLVVTTFVMYFSPTPGASGIAEGIFGHFFSGILTANHLVLVTIAWRFLTIYIGMLIGVVVTQLELSRSRSTGART